MEKTLAKSKIFSPIAKAVLVAVVSTVAGILALSIVCKFVDMSDTTIKICNQIIKIVSVLFGTMVVLKADNARGWLKGMLVGLIYTIVVYTLFSAIIASFSFNLSFVFDALFAALAGAICGVLLVNLKK